MSGRRRLAFALLRWSGVPWLLRVTLQRRRVTILVYHDPAPVVLEQHLRVLARAYNAISLEQDLNARAQKGSALPANALVITFDDGYASNFDLLEPLRRYGVRPSVFVCTGIVGTRRGFWFRHCEAVETLKRVPDHERLETLSAAGFDVVAGREPREALSDEEIAELASVADIQAHTVSHPILPRCSADVARTEIVEAKRELEERFGFDVYAFAYPNGEFTEREVALVGSAGYRCALAVGGRTNRRSADLFQLQRIAIDDRDGVDELLVKASGLWPWIRRIVAAVR